VVAVVATTAVHLGLVVLAVAGTVAALVLVPQEQQTLAAVVAVATRQVVVLAVLESYM